MQIILLTFFMDETLTDGINETSWGLRTTPIIFQVAHAYAQSGNKTGS